MIDKNKAFVFDLDGTLANGNGRDFYNPKPEEIIADLPIEPTIKVLLELKENYEIVFLSGREAKFFNSTQDWIWNHLTIENPHLYMRKTGDQRKDAIIKWELYQSLIKPNFNVIGLFDDRKQVVDMWIKKGLFVFDVAQGKGNF